MTTFALDYPALNISVDRVTEHHFIECLLYWRSHFRAKKEWGKADDIRAQITRDGWAVLDYPDRHFAERDGIAVKAYAYQDINPMFCGTPLQSFTRWCYTSLIDTHYCLSHPAIQKLLADGWTIDDTSGKPMAIKDATRLMHPSDRYCEAFLRFQSQYIQKDFETRVAMAIVDTRVAMMKTA